MNKYKGSFNSGIRVLRRGGFSDRKGLVKINNIVQTESLDERTRIALINITIEVLESLIAKNNIEIEKFAKYLYCDVLCMKNSQIPYVVNIYGGNYISLSSIKDLIDGIISNNPYEDALTLVESIVQYFIKRFPGVQDIYNEIFEHECVGYRMIEGVMTDCISKAEILEVQQVLEDSFSICPKHIEKSMKLLFDRSNPDYENSIKESIIAVEALCQIIAEKKTTLGSVLDIIVKKGISIHPALKAAFEKIYGYTSDADGIRHANGFGGPEATFEEARYMLVSCSAFINYLIALHKKSEKNV